LSAPFTKTANEFYFALCDSRLLSTEQVESLNAVRPHESVDGASWIAGLVGRGFLTDFQAEQLLAGQTDSLILGQYRLLGRLGVGGMGHVYKAEHVVMKRVVALKVIAAHLVTDASAVARFHHEVELAARLSHPNIITAHDAAEANGLHFLVMEYVEGIDLAGLLKENGPLPLVEACEYIRQAALGLQHAHAHGLVHCDIKPANLLLRRGMTSAPGVFAEPLVKILDFGLARLAGSPSKSVAILSGCGDSPDFAGTPDYTAPEQAWDCLAADIRSDLYGLGCTLYHLLTGQPPFPGGTWSEKVFHHHFDPAPPVTGLRPEVPQAIACVVHRLLAKSPGERYQEPIEVAEALYAWLSEQGFQGEPPLATAYSKWQEKAGARGTEAMHASRRARKPWFWLFASMAAIALGLGIASLAYRPSQAVPQLPSSVAFASGAATDWIGLSSDQGKRFTRLEAAISAARDEETVVIHGAGPFSISPIAIQGKSLSIKAARGSHPRLELTRADTDSIWQPLLLTDRPLTLQGLELACTNSGRPAPFAGASHLVYCQHASLRMTDCRLLAPSGNSLVVCRNCTNVELRNCSLTAQASAICLEAGNETSSELRLVDTKLIVNDSQGAALSLWTNDRERRSAVRLHLERDKIDAGRIFALAGPVQGVQVFAERSEFTFHQALLSCAGSSDMRCLQRSWAWQGRDNRYQGQRDWLLVDGKPVNVSEFPAWQQVWRADEPQAVQKLPVPSLNSAFYGRGN